MKLFLPDHIFHECSHGPQDWSIRPWYKPISWIICKADLLETSTNWGYHLWIYTKYGSIMFGIYKR